MKNRWVLLRGLGRERGHWGDFPEQMSATFPHWEIISLDLPGFGAKSDIRSPAHMDEVVRALDAELASLEHRHNHILALSLGAMVALAWAKQAPHTFESVTLVNSSSSLSPIHHRLKPSGARALLRAMFATNANERERQILELVSNHPSRPARIHTLWTALARSNRHLLINALRQLWMVAQFSPPLQLTVPGQCLVSRQDRLVDSRCSQRLAESLSWPLVTHDWAGHDLAVDDPEWLLVQLQNWVSKSIQN